MASLARGFCLPGLRPFLSPRAIRPSSVSLLQSRLFTTSLRRLAEPITKSTSAATKSRVAPSRYAFIKSLASKPTPTILYEGPSHFWFYFGCWTSGVTILTWSLFTAPTAMTQPEGVPQWVGLVFGASYVLLVSMSLWLLSRTSNIVSTIRVLPGQATKLAAAAGSPASVGPTPLHMEVTVKSMVPFLRPKVRTVPLDKVSLKSRFSLPEEYVPELKRIELERAAEVKRMAQRKFDMEHLFTMPFRRMGRAFAAMFNGVKSAWTDMGFGTIRVDGKEYKVDVTKGFAHDGFRTLEKLVEVKP